jgi:hypothetical protein
MTDPHPAQRIAADLWDERDLDGRLRDLLPHEQAFLTEMRQIDKDCTRVCGEANRAFGTDSKAALAVEFTARQRRDERYQGALCKYEAACLECC